MRMSRKVQGEPGEDAIMEAKCNQEGSWQETSDTRRKDN